MASKICIEGKRPVTQRSKHTATAAADVCLTPQGPALVPVPYVNRAASQDLRRGSRKVWLQKGSVMLKASKLQRSTGNQLGRAGGIKSKQTCGPCRAVQTARRVCIEGQAVVLGGALTLHNGDNAVGRMGR